MPNLLDRVETVALQATSFANDMAPWFTAWALLMGLLCFI